MTHRAILLVLRGLVIGAVLHAMLLVRSAVAVVPYALLRLALPVRWR